MTNERITLEEPFVRVDIARGRELIGQGIQVVDVREPGEYAEGHIPSARLVPLNTFLQQPQKHVTAGPVLFVCAVGVRSALACEMAAAIGVADVYNLEGGTREWINRGLPIER
ncbi:MAG: rhodanese-like domain-containing protein [Chloroflexi bacterium]|nr:rhodanese-like domain-containing protein [Chloroflexota bacterium]